jgi:hypothetical protein
MTPSWKKRPAYEAPAEFEPAGERRAIHMLKETVNTYHPRASPTQKEHRQGAFMLGETLNI